MVQRPEMAKQCQVQVDVVGYCTSSGHGNGTQQTTSELTAFMWSRLLESVEQAFMGVVSSHNTETRTFNRCLESSKKELFLRQSQATFRAQESTSKYSDGGLDPEGYNLFKWAIATASPPCMICIPFLILLHDSNQIPLPILLSFELHVSKHLAPFSKLITCVL